jgi:hypothetical protein
MPETRQSTRDDMQAQIEALQEQVASMQESLRRTPASYDSNAYANPSPYGTKLPPIQLITPKLDGKRTYRSWSINIEAIAQSIENIWNVIEEHDTHAPASQRQYARSLLLLNMVPNMQAEVRGMNTASEIWAYLRGQFGTNEFTDLLTLVRRLQNIRWSTDTDIEEFYQEFKDAQMTIKEVTGQPLHELVLISIFLHAIDESFSEFVLLVEAQLSQPSTVPIQKTFEYTFGRFRTEFYRRQARDTRASLVGRVSEREHCAACQKVHGKVCWTQFPEQAPVHLQNFYRKKFTEWELANAPRIT